MTPAGPAPVAPRPASAPHGLWGRAFRPFFLGLALYACLALPLWMAIWLGAVPAPPWLGAPLWHGHEMVFGLVAAAIAGFLLTAAPVWSGGPPLVGAGLAALFGLWLAGRIAFAAAALLPAAGLAAIDAAFLPAVALAAIRSLWGSGQRRNYAVVGIVGVLALANAAMHAAALGLAPGLAGPALRFGVDAVVVLLLVIGGRITPAFTRNALQRRGIDRPVRSSPWLDGATIGAAAALAVVGLVSGRGPWTGVLAAAAGIGAGLRLAGWQSLEVRSDPLLWSLHAGAAWLVVGLLLVAASDLGAPVPAAVGLHALTAGAIGATLLAVMTRVGLGHTGRPLELGSGVVACFLLVYAGALARVGAPFAAGGGQRVLLVASSAAWAAAFGLFALRYWPILTRPRPDGLPG